MGHQVRFEFFWLITSKCESLKNGFNCWTKNFDVEVTISPNKNCKSLDQVKSKSTNFALIKWEVIQKTNFTGGINLHDETTDDSTKTSLT